MTLSSPQMVPRSNLKWHITFARYSKCAPSSYISGPAGDFLSHLPVLGFPIISLFSVIKAQLSLFCFHFPQKQSVFLCFYCKPQRCPCLPFTKHLPVCNFPGSCASLPLLHISRDPQKHLFSSGPFLLFCRRLRSRTWRHGWTVAWSKVMPTL